MKNILNINSIRTIKQNLPRFISLIIMSLLGVMVFVGLLSTSPDMLTTLDNYYDEKNVYDIKILSSMGLIEDDILSLKKLNNVKDVEGIYSTDVLLSNDQDEYIVNISSIPTLINKLELIQGRLPKKENEIVVENNFVTKTKYKVGDTINVESDILKNTKLTIVGTIDSPLYFNSTNITQNRGATSLGNGIINYYSYVIPSNFDVDYYTNIYITLNNSKDMVTSKNKYLKIIEKITKEIDNIKGVQETNRYNKIFTEANEEIQKNENTVKKELQNANEKLIKAKKELNSAKNKLTESKQQLTVFKETLDNAKKELDNNATQLDSVLKEIGLSESELVGLINQLELKIQEIELILSQTDNNDNKDQQMKQQLYILQEQYKELTQLKNAKDEIQKGYNEYQSNYELYTSSYKKYNSGILEYTQGLKEYEKRYKEYQNNKQKALDEIAKSKKELTSIKKPNWYIFDRSDDQTYSIYIGQTQSLQSLATIFPMVFYAVAVLVSLISMNRMVEDDRGEIGTLKSLGFTNKEIIHKYLAFSLLATLIGGALGIFLGITIIPYLIFYIYKILFVLPNFYLGLNLNMSIAGLVIAIICICGATLTTINMVLKEKPAELMRPKAPISGKTILIEHIPIWKKINFSNKITIRNLFRYKKRVLVTIIGICGCTSLMLCGFGLKDSIVDVTNKQYKDTYKYDETVYVNNLNHEDIKEIFSHSKIEEYILTEQKTASIDESSLTMIFMDYKDFSNIFNTKDAFNNKSLQLSKNSILITNKLAELKNINVGDTITVLDSEANKYTLKIDGIVKNYIGHYIYIDKSNIKDYTPNTAFLKTNIKNQKEQDKLTKELLANEEIINVVHTETLMDTTRDMIKSLDLIIVVLVCLSALLSFVVLYNLSNINIIERKREIATLKVLGFYDKEVDNYITRENIILTILGVIPGFCLGYFLTFITIATIEMENIRFQRIVNLQSYIYAAIISLAFAFIVNFVMHFRLKKINMIESLKSVE